MTSKTFFLDQHGCAKNQVDGELIITRLENLGFERTEDASCADLIIVNSCGFIESAKTESLNSLMQAKDSYPNAKIVLAGCLAERYADVFKDNLPEADAVFGNGDMSKLDGVVDSLFKGERPVVKEEQRGVCCGDRNTLLSFKGSAYVKITEGCDNRCTFCAIPLIRGTLRSRPVDEIVDEIKLLLSRGVYEINLIGQDLAAFGCGKDDVSFSDKEFSWHDVLYSKLKEPVIADPDFSSKYGDSELLTLIKKISLLPGNFWVRLLYIHPDHFNPDILDFMKTDSRFLPYFDIPFQSGSDSIIKSMNRKGQSKDYVSLVRKIREVFPESCIRTTFLTGFPGESEKNAEETKSFLKEIQSDWSGCFSYSLEEDTPAYKMKHRVPHKKAEKRSLELQEIQAEITACRLKERTGKTYDVLVEEIVQNAEEGSDEGLAIGRAWFEAPEVDGSVVIRYDLSDPRSVASVQEGNVVKVKVVSSSAVDLDGMLLLGED